MGWEAAAWPSVCVAHSLRHHQKKPYPGREGAAATAPMALQSSWGWGTATQPHTEQLWCLCAAPGENRDFRGSCLTYFRAACQGFSSCLPAARQGFTQMELPAGAWGSTHCFGAVCLVLGALYIVPRALHCSRGSINCSKGSALLWGSVQCTRDSIHCSKGSVHCSRSSVHHSKGSAHCSGALYTAARASAHCHLAVSLTNCWCC